MATTVTPLSSVRDVVQRYPGSEGVFDRHGLAGCGGDNGPDEPIGFFAAIHHVDAGALVDELNAFIAASAPVVAEPATAAAPGPTYPLFVVAALLLTLVFGLTTGVAAAMSDAYQALPGDAWVALVQAHGHLQLFGFLGLFIMGMAYHIVPRFKAVGPPDRRLVFASYGLVLGGVILRANAQPHGQGVLRWLFAASGPVELAGAILFAGLMAKVLLGARDRREPMDRFLVAACGFLVLSLGMNAYQTIDAARAGSRVIELTGDAAGLEAAIHGFVLLFILGISFRVLPFFMRLRPARATLRDGSLALLVLAVLARTAALWAPAFTAASWPNDLVHFATFGEVVAIAGLVVALRVFEPATPGAPEGARVPFFGLMVRTAFVWLVTGAALDAYWLLREVGGAVTPYYAAGALRHTVLAGFAITMVVAMSYRTIPVFAGRELPWRRAVPAVFALIVAGAALRVFPVVFVLAPSRLDYYLLGFGGASLFVGLAIVTIQLSSVMFGWWQTPVRSGDASTSEGSRPAIETASEPSTVVGPPESVAGRMIRGDMTVAQAVAVHPMVLDLLVQAGFQPLSNPVTRAAMAPTITLDRAADVIGLPPDELVDRLNLVVNAVVPAPDEGGPAPVDLDLAGATATRDEVFDALGTCYDPEIPVNIVDLGLVYGVRIHDGHARAAITLTSPGCPAGDALVADVEEALLGLPGITDARARVLYEPHWTPARMSRQAKEALGLVGAR